MGKPRIICLVGPTASGKTAVAVELARLIPLEMISSDSMQVYRDMPILTQAPTEEILKKIPTHLVSFLDPSEEYSAAKFRKDAGALIPEILKRKKTPLIVGGTGLYVRALLDGLFEAGEGEVASDAQYRQELLEQQKTHGENFLHQKLETIDPVAAKKIHPNDTRRLVRALEVFHLSGKTISEQKPTRQGIRDQYEVRIFLLNPPRQELYDRIHRRVEAMLREGLLKEVENLQSKHLSQTAEVALGYREISSFLKGQIKLEEAIELIQKNTRHYAKRQLSWFRHEREVETIDVPAAEAAAQTAHRIFDVLQKGA